MFTYNFGVPGPVIWTTHIIIGLFLFYAGYQLYQKKSLTPVMTVTILVLGALAALYHAHLMFYNLIILNNSSKN